jgi:kynurenine formamidase
MPWSLSPLIARGLMLDVPRALGLERLPAHHMVDVDQLERACAICGVAPRRGDVVLVRTGAMAGWPEPDQLAAAEGAGIGLAAASWLAAHHPAAVGADTGALEVLPSTVAGDPHPVHRLLLRDHGIPILEWVNQEALARDGVHEFLFVCIPLTIRGATGSLVRPLAIA